MTEILNPSRIGKAVLVLLMIAASLSCVPGKGLYAAPKAEPQNTAAQAEKMVNVNKANLEELQTVRGIGPVIAERILQYRNEHGPFAQVGDIVNVQGIGEAKFEKIKNQLSV
ncbi:MAG: helix-hairpin-helix domain-containing protein [Candidatus Omnitrophica bacterium]|nr:helix-hairpin-helix domain-containing protein [Candidatus Omnitrophota bacterium]